MSFSDQINLIKVEVKNGKMLTCPEEIKTIKLDQKTSVTHVKQQLKNQDVIDPIIFDSGFKEVKEGMNSVGLRFWNTGDKFYFCNLVDWNYAQKMTNREKKYRMSLIMVEIIDEEIEIKSNIPIDLDDSTANVKYIEDQLKQDLNVENSLVLLDSKFKVIFDSYSTRGQNFWNRSFKFYFADKASWTAFMSNPKRENTNPHIKHKKINRPIDYDCTFKPTQNMYFPVTGPRTFKKAITWIKIQNEEILIYKDVPFDLTEPTANIPTIHKIIRDNLNIPEPIILDRKFQEVRDNAKTRGENMWNNNNKFYFIDKYEWQRFDYSLPNTEFDRIKFRNIKHKTYFDKSRKTYFKNV